MSKVAIGHDQLVIWVAKDTGIFAKNNLDAQPIYFSGNPFSSPHANSVEFSLTHLALISYSIATVNLRRIAA